MSHRRKVWIVLIALPLLALFARAWSDSDPVTTEGRWSEVSVPPNQILFEVISSTN